MASSVGALNAGGCAAATWYTACSPGASWVANSSAALLVAAAAVECCWLHKRFYSVCSGLPLVASSLIVSVLFLSIQGNCLAFFAIPQTLPGNVFGEGQAHDALMA